MNSAPADTLLVANRGEIALRIIRACHRLNLRVVCVYSDDDRDAAYLKMADESIGIGPADARKSYLNIAAILAAAKATGATLIHPGYGFLAENAAFADAVAEAGLTLVGPSAAAMRTMGDKIAARQAMIAAGIPCVPGTDTSLPEDPAELAAIANNIGYPVIVKAAGGGGGRGMRVVQNENELANACLTTKQEATRFFGNPDIYLEKFLQQPRHVEIQVIADNHGNVLWLGDRDCSMQRRHQKLIEEAPAPGIDRAAINDIGERCAALCKDIAYSGAGTFEFLYEDGRFSFIEMNTRIQVEHTVTEMVTGLDIVALQIDCARGMRLPVTQADVNARGHAVECRINAEDGLSHTPAAGHVLRIHLPGGPGIRVDTHVCDGTFVPPGYDSLLAKLIAHGADRAEALARARSAVAEMVIEGVPNNLSLHRELLADPGFCEGGVHIHYLENWLSTRTQSNG